MLLWLTGSVGSIVADDHLTGSEHDIPIPVFKTVPCCEVLDGKGPYIIAARPAGMIWAGPVFVAVRTTGELFNQWIYKTEYQDQPDRECDRTEWRRSAGSRGDSRSRRVTVDQHGRECPEGLPGWLLLGVPHVLAALAVGTRRSDESASVSPKPAPGAASRASELAESALPVASEQPRASGSAASRPPWQSEDQNPWDRPDDNPWGGTRSGWRTPAEAPPWDRERTQ